MGLSSIQIDQQIDKLRQAILTEEEDHRKLAFEYTETGNQAVMEKMTAIRNTIQFYHDAIRSSEIAREIALECEAAEYDVEKKQERRVQIMEFKKLLDQRVGVAKKLDRKFSELGKLMDEFRAVSKQCNRQSRGLIGNTTELVTARMFRDPPMVFGWRNSLRSAGLSEMVGPNFQSNDPTSPFADASLADCIGKQHEILAGRVLSSVEED